MPTKQRTKKITGKTRVKKEKPQDKKQVSKPRYVEAVGRRKTAIARVRLFSGTKEEIEINGKPYHEYFPTAELRLIVEDPFRLLQSQEKFSARARVYGGGIHAQAEAIRHGIARVLVAHYADAAIRKQLKHAGFLRRDPRMKERRKFGLKKARKAPQWSKR